MGRIDKAYDFLDKGGDHQAFLARLADADALLPAEVRQAENNLSLYLDQRVIYGSQGVRAINPPRTVLRVNECHKCHLSYSWMCLCSGLQSHVTGYSTAEEGRLNACIRSLARETSLLAEMKQKKRQYHLDLVSRCCVGLNHPLIHLRRVLEQSPRHSTGGEEEEPGDLKTVKKDLDKIQKDIVETEKKLREMKEREAKLSVEYERLMTFQFSG